MVFFKLFLEIVKHFFLENKSLNRDSRFLFISKWNQWGASLSAIISIDRQFVHFADVQSWRHFFAFANAMGVQIYGDNCR